MAKLQHVFVVQSALQEHLANAVIARRNIDPGVVMKIYVRGRSLAKGAAVGNSVVVRGFGRASGWNVPAHRRRNAATLRRFEAELAADLAPGFEMYSAMYDYWYVRLLRERAGVYHLLEDGLGSYQTFADLFDALGLYAKDTATPLTRLRRRLCLPRGMRVAEVEWGALIGGVSQHYCASELAFPEIPAPRKVVLRNVFPPVGDGRYDDCVLFAPSALVENGLCSLPDYLEMLRRIAPPVGRLATRRIYFKWHPRQTNGPHQAAYEGVLRAAWPTERLKSLPGDADLEGLLAGNDLTLVTGFSSLCLHASGRPVFSYLRPGNSYLPTVTAGQSTTIQDLLTRVTRPLT